MTGIVATSYGLNHNKAYAGMVADGELANIVSKLNAGDTTIKYGKGVFRNGETNAELPSSTSSAADFVGVAVRELNRSYADGQVFGAVPHKDFSAITVGVIWVVAAEAVTLNAPAFVRTGATGNGDFAMAEGAGATLAVAIPNAKFVSAGSAGDLVKLSIVVGG